MIIYHPSLPETPCHIFRFFLWGYSIWHIATVSPSMQEVRMWTSTPMSRAGYNIADIMFLIQDVPQRITPVLLRVDIKLSLVFPVAGWWMREANLPVTHRVWATTRNPTNTDYPTAAPTPPFPLALDEILACWLRHSLAGRDPDLVTRGRAGPTDIKTTWGECVAGKKSIRI